MKYKTVYRVEQSMTNEFISTDFESLRKNIKMDKFSLL
jgi:hypothetical protein